MRYSPLRDEFPRERFLRTPVSELFETLDRITHHEQLQANINSVTTANLLQTVYQIALGMSGSKAKVQTKSKDYLPYPKWKPRSAAATGPSMVTTATLDRLVVEGKIPMHVYISLTDPAPE